ncbi:MAG: hypothetical protein MMC23_002905 [Stictis urceolatum]|nr:hypothetical protein [Stictis urceolata]
MASTQDIIATGGESQPVTEQASISTNAEPNDSQTASDYIDSQLKLEADAREALPYSFDHCTQPLGPLKQNIYSCLTCNPPPSEPSVEYKPAGVCYGCSISCHGEHTLVELFARRDYTCDCGTTRLPDSAPCTLRINPNTGTKGPVHSQEPAKGNTYNQNFRNHFCGCKEHYDVEKQKGTMFQCLGLATEEQGGCSEDWWHPECLLGLPRDWYVAKVKEMKTSEDKPVDGASIDINDEEEEEHPIPPGFPDEDDFDTLICYKCVEATPWLKAYASSTGFKALSYAPADVKSPEQAIKQVNENAVQLNAKVGTLGPSTEEGSASKKRKAEDDVENESSKKAKVEDEEETKEPSPKPLHAILPKAPKGVYSIVTTEEEYRERFCRCAECYPRLSQLPQLLEEEETYKPPVSEEGDAQGGSVGTGSLLDRGEAALSNVDRVRAIEGVMVYNHLRDKVKDFLQPFAESGKAVGAEDIKAYFEKLRGDQDGIRAAGAAVAGDGSDGDNRREQSGY